MTKLASHTRFVELMTKLFQLDEAEALDFGFYRIIRRHNREVQEFLGEVTKQDEEKFLHGGRLSDILESTFAQEEDEDAAETSHRLSELEKALGLSRRTALAKREATLGQLENIPATRDTVAEYRALSEQNEAAKTAESDHNEVLNLCICIEI